MQLQKIQSTKTSPKDQNEGALGDRRTGVSVLMVPFASSSAAPVGFHAPHQTAGGCLVRDTGGPQKSLLHVLQTVSHRNVPVLSPRCQTRRRSQASWGRTPSPGLIPRARHTRCCHWLSLGHSPTSGARGLGKKLIDSPSLISGSAWKRRVSPPRVRAALQTPTRQPPVHLPPPTPGSGGARPASPIQFGSSDAASASTQLLGNSSSRRIPGLSGANRFKCRSCGWCRTVRPHVLSR